VRAATRVNAEQASHGEAWVKGRVQSRMSRTPAGIAVSKVRARLHNLVVSAPDQPHIRSPFATAAPTSRLRRAGLRRREPFSKTAFQGHGLLRFVHLDPSELITSRGLRYWMRGRRGYRQAGLIMAPSITTPALTYFQSATSSFRASATIVVLRRRPPLRLIRSWNQRVSAERG
jgi:hypothetical protein